MLAVIGLSLLCAVPIAAQNVVPPAPTGSGASLGSNIQGWDPYSTTPQYGASSAPSISGSPYGAAPSSTYVPPASFPPPPTSPPASFSGGPPAYYPQQQSPIYQPSQPFATPQFQQGTFPSVPYERFLENLAFQYTLLPKFNDDPDKLQTQDLDFSATALFPDFLFSQQPLLITPAFVMHLWDGPANGVQDLPSNAYSAYLDLSWNPELTPRLYTELGFRIGAYSDFDTFSNDSVRIQGLGVGNIRLTPTTTLKAGVVYIDRLDIKLLPVFGILWEPNNLSRFDITFPYPRLSRYWTTFGDKKVWWYIGGEYGGGSWTIKRYNFPTQTNENDQIDINDFRVFAGLESTHPNRLRAYIEVGYVWDRDVIYRSKAVPDIRVDDTIMFRTGFNF